jgi:2-C-methyl-D-erythritol 4-phosphate cytidylyltransferase/2-C-methyl-D-erythritol 2,4-cyclodiphosphate synthase
MAAGRPKQFLELGGLPVLARTVALFRELPEIREIIVAAPSSYLQETREMLERFTPGAVVLVTGGETRQESVRAGLAVVSPEIELVVVHDGVRPLLEPKLVRDCLAAATESGAAMLAIPVKDTVKEVNAGMVVARTIDRQDLWLAQTPQVARRELLAEAFASALREDFVGTDEAALLERIGCKVRIVMGAERNLKITRPEDLALASALLKERAAVVGPSAIRVGHGYDAHQLGLERRLVLGGVDIPFERGLIGHSDADVLLHALCDAMLGAAGLGDIGRHFPDSDPALEGISSLCLLERVVEKLSAQAFKLLNADVTVVAQRPKLSPYFPAMQENIARVCLIGLDCINLKATTTEKMGFTGREEGIAAHAVVLIEQGGSKVW